MRKKNHSPNSTSILYNHGKKGMDKILCTCTYTFIINIATNIHVLYQNIQINNVHVHRRRKLKMTNFKHTVKHQINTHYYD